MILAAAKPRPTGKHAKPVTPEEQKRRFHELCGTPGADRGETPDHAFGKIAPAKARETTGLPVWTVPFVPYTALETGTLN